MDSAITEQLHRIERKLDALLAALADEDEGADALDLEGQLLPRERDQSREL